MKSKKNRCPWVNESNTLTMSYHDREWGRPLHDDDAHFELLSLECFQAGLSWNTILNKRANFRSAFEGFIPKKVAGFSTKKVTQLLQNAGIIRNKLKIQSVISNAKVFLKVQKEFGSFDRYLWKFVNNKPIINTFQKLSDYPAKTPLSDKISKDLKQRGFRFVGSTIMYAYMQSAGLVQDHSLHCYLGGKKLKRLLK